MERLETLRLRSEAAVELITTHVRYLLRKRGLMHPDELKHHVIGRVKSVESCVRKIRRVERTKRIHLRSSAEIQRHIDDIAGIRVVCDYLSDLYLVYGYIRGCAAFREIHRKFEDYISQPKFGYRALHTVLEVETAFGRAKCEVQIRTALQDAWAAKSHALLYKLGKADLAALPKALMNLLVRQSDLLYNMDKSAQDIAKLVRRYLRENVR